MLVVEFVIVKSCTGITFFTYSSKQFLLGLPRVFMPVLLILVPLPYHGVHQQQMFRMG